MIYFEIISIFPHIFDSYFNTSIVNRAIRRGLIRIKIHDLRKWTKDKHRTVDDRPYGGGPGMIMKADIIYQALESIQGKNFNKTDRNKSQKIILLTPSGKQFDQRIAEKHSHFKKLIFICGHYEGFDARVEKFVDEKISVGPYILTGGELPAMAIIDSITRLIPGAIRRESLNEESFSKSVGNFEYPQYTRPEILTVNNGRGTIKKFKVPKVLLTGDHRKIREWKLNHLK